MDVAAQTPQAPAELPPLSATSLRAQAVSGLLEARRSDLVGAERAVGEPGAAARMSLANVWPEEGRDRPDARAAQEISLTRGDEAAADRKRAGKERRAAAIRADLITRTAADEAARAAEALDQAQRAAQADRVDRAREASSADRARQAGSADQGTGADRADNDAAHDRSAVAQTRAAAASRAGLVEGAEQQEPETEHTPTLETVPEPNRPPGLADVARAADDVRRLRDAIAGYAGTVRDGIERAVGDANDLLGRVAALNDRIGAAVDGGRPVPQDLARTREQLVVAVARLTGATAQPGPRAAVDVLLDGRALVSGDQSSTLAAETGLDGAQRISIVDGPTVTPSSGVLASRTGTYNGVLAALAGASTSVLGLLAEQAGDPSGGSVAGGPLAAGVLGGLLREVAHAAESSAMYAQVAAGVENLVSRLTHGDMPAAVRGSDLLLGAVETTTQAAPATLSAEATVGPLRAALGALGAVTAEASAPGATAPVTSLISGAPGIASLRASSDAPARHATVRVLSVAAGGAVATAQSFHPDSPLGNGRESTIGIVENLGTASERTTVIDVGRYPTPADLVSYINQSGAGVRASLNELTGGTVQLHLESLATGRGQNITIVNGAQPPAASSVLGRVTQLTAARDTMVEVQRAGRTAAIMHSATTSVPDVLPGVSLDVHRADTSRVFEVGVRRQTADAVGLAGRLADRAKATIGAARAAGATGTAEAVLGALGFAPGAAGATSGAAGIPGAGAAGSGAPNSGAPSSGAPNSGALNSGAPNSGDAVQRAGGRVPFPGLHLDRRGDPALDKRELAAAFEADAEGTASRLSAAGRALSAVAANVDGATWEAYVAARAAQGPEPLGTYTPGARKTGRDDTIAHDLTRRENALLAVLTKLQDQGDWLGRQLAQQPS